MASLTSQLIVRLIDQVTGPAGRAAGALRGLQGAARSAAPVAAGMAVLQRGTNRFTQSAQTAAAVIGGPTAVAAATGYNTMVQFSKELNKAMAIGELTREQGAQVERQARDIGRDTQFTAMQALQMMRTLIAAGRTVDQARGMTRPILDAALFGDVDPKTAADGIIAITSAYRQQMRTTEEAAQVAGRVGDIIAKAANLSRASFEDIMQGFKYAAPIAQSTGWSMEQLAAAIAHMANNGLRGDEAGVALRGMLVRMVRPTREARQAMAELGLSFDDFFKKAKDFNLDNFASGMANAGHRLNTAQRRQIQEAVRRNAALPEDQQNDIGQVLTDAMIAALRIPQNRTQDRQKIARAVQAYASSLMEGADPDTLFRTLEERGATAGHMARIFDARAGSRLMTLFGDGFKQILDEIRKSAEGASRRGAAQMEQGLYGAHQRLGSAWENIILTLGKEGGFMETLSKTLTSVAESLNSMAQTNPEGLKQIATVLLGFAALAPIGLVLSGIAASFGMLHGALVALAGVLATLHGTLAAMGLVTAAGSTGAAVLGGGAAVGGAVAAGGAAYVAGRVIDEVGQIAAGKHWTPQNPAAVADLQVQADALRAQIEGIKARTHPSMQGMPNPQLSNLESQLQDLQNRIAEGLRANAGDMQQAGQELGAKVPEGVNASAGEARAAGAALGSQVMEGLRSTLNGAAALGAARAATGGATTPAGARAGGGPVSGGRAYVVGERGRELFVPGSNGRIIPNGSGAGGGAGGGGRSVTVSPTITVHGAGGDPAEIARKVKDQLEELVQTAFRSIQADTGQSFAT